MARRLAALQSRLPPIAARMRLKLLPVGSLGVLQLLLSPSLSLPLCSHGLPLRQSQALQAPLIITTIYGNPLSSLHGLTSWVLSSYTNDVTLWLCIRAIIILLQRAREGGMMNLAPVLPHIVAPVAITFHHPTLASCCVL